MDSFANLDPSGATIVLADEEQVDEDEDVVIRGAIAQIAKHPELTSQGVDFILIAKNLERVADHATNIAEDVIYLVEGDIVRHRMES